MRKIFTTMLVCIVAVAAFAQTEKQIVGNYKGEVTMTGADANNEQAKQAKAYMDKMGGITLSLTADKKFVMKMFGAQQIEGTWTLTKGELSMKPEKMNGKTMKQMKEEMAKAGRPANSQSDKPLLMTVSADGKTLTAKEENQGMKRSGLVFKRV